ncbi:wall-associated receptor kinase 2-like [Carex rostrata]
MAILFFFMLLLSFSVAQPIFQPPAGCPTHCGDTEVTYPFGIGKNCSRSEEFDILCNKTIDGSYKAISLPASNGSESVLQSISVSQGQARFEVVVSWLCHINSSFNRGSLSTVDLTESPFWLSNTENRFMVLGSETSAYVRLTSKSIWDTIFNPPRSRPIWYETGCTSVSLSEQGLVNGSCSGMGCCQTAIPFGMRGYDITFDFRFHSSNTSSFSPCGYAMLIEKNFKFSTTYLTKTDSFNKDANTFSAKDAKKFSVVFDWVAGNETCKIAKQNRTHYACVSTNSQCVDRATGQGYICNCAPGYHGNPYLLNGCQGPLRHGGLRG